jgi:hypothetical protein
MERPVAIRTNRQRGVAGKDSIVRREYDGNGRQPSRATTVRLAATAPYISPTYRVGHRLIGPRQPALFRATWSVDAAGARVAPVPSGDVHGAPRARFGKAISSSRSSPVRSPSTPGHHRPSECRSDGSTRRPATACASSWSTMPVLSRCRCWRSCDPMARKPRPLAPPALATLEKAK